MAKSRNRQGAWYEQLRGRIKAAIERKGITQTELARRMGVTDGAVSRWLTESMPEPHLLPRLARILDVDGNYLLEITFKVAGDVAGAAVDDIEDSKVTRERRARGARRRSLHGKPRA